MTPVMVTCPNGPENSAHEHFRGERGAPLPSDLPEPPSKPPVPAFLWRMRVPAGLPDPAHYPSGAAEVKMQVTGC
ncbi:MAG: hypothetical protein QOJ20_249 [Mycobacterium sp.]|jgi:hypothetical protein|nr:hypothetical protein [Mycobacterium sp.]MDT5279054.1 hypothetical protein [Mycobacterium sp.]